MDTLNIIFGIATLISLIFTIYFGIKANKLEKSRKKLEWTDLQASANDLGDLVKKDKFTPDIIFTPGLRGATFTNLLKQEINKEVPVFVGISIWKEKAENIQPIPDFIMIETNKWYIFMPNGLLKQNSKKVLIIDDYVMSGDFLEKLKQVLIDNGFDNDNIKTMSIVTTQVAINNHKAPNYHWLITKDDSFYFPWGKAK